MIDHALPPDLAAAPPPVADTAIMPVIPAGNTQAPTMAMAWRAADIIRRGALPH